MTIQDAIKKIDEILAETKEITPFLKEQKNNAKEVTAQFTVEEFTKFLLELFEHETKALENIRKELIENS